MNEILHIILNYISIWLPAVVAVFSTVGTVLVALNKFKAAVDEFKKEDVLKALRADLSKAIKDNEDIKQQNDILIDELKKIKNYRENLND